MCGNIGTHTPDSSLDAHAFGACTHETLPQSRLAKDLVIGKSGEVCSQPSYCRICRSRCTDCDLAQIVEEWIGDLCPGGDDGGGECRRNRADRSGIACIAASPCRLVRRRGWG